LSTGEKKNSFLTKSTTIREERPAILVPESCPQQGPRLLRLDRSSINMVPVQTFHRQPLVLRTQTRAPRKESLIIKLLHHVRTILVRAIRTKICRQYSANLRRPRLGLLKQWDRMRKHPNTKNRSFRSPCRKVCNQRASHQCKKAKIRMLSKRSTRANQHRRILCKLSAKNHSNKVRTRASRLIVQTIKAIFLQASHQCKKAKVRMLSNHSTRANQYCRILCKLSAMNHSKKVRTRASRLIARTIKVIFLHCSLWFTKRPKARLLRSIMYLQ